VGLLHTKLKEFLDLEQQNHSVFDYTRQFNTLVQYMSYHVDKNEKRQPVPCQAHHPPAGALDIVHQPVIQ
jgi:hypothetical protein